MHLMDLALHNCFPDDVGHGGRAGLGRSQVDEHITVQRLQGDPGMQCAPLSSSGGFSTVFCTATHFNTTPSQHPVTNSIVEGRKDIV